MWRGCNAETGDLTLEISCVPPFHVHNLHSLLYDSRQFHSEESLNYFKSQVGTFSPWRALDIAAVARRRPAPGWQVKSENGHPL